MLAIVIATITLLGILAATGWLIWNLVSSLQSTAGGAYYVPLEEEVSSHMLQLAGIKPGDIVCDLGCGDGRNLIQAVQRYGARGIGAEIAVLPYVRATQQIRKLGLTDRITIYQDNLFQVNLSPVDVLVLYLSPQLLGKLVPKIKAECKPGTRIVCARYSLPHMTPQIVDETTLYPIYLYQI